MLLQLTISSSKEIVASILWQIWKARNHFIFRRQRTDPDQLVEAALADEMLYRNSSQQSAISDSALPNPNRLWTPPDQGSFKANIDGAFTSDTHFGAIACVLRDSTGILIGGCSSSVRASSALQCEAQALISTLTYLLEQGKEEDHLIIESDCLTLVESINDCYSSPWEIRAFVADASVLRRSFPRLRIQYCRREANAAAPRRPKLEKLFHLLGPLFLLHRYRLCCVLTPCLRVVIFVRLEYEYLRL